MKQTYILCILSLIWGMASAQIDTRNTVATGGGEYESAYESVQFTVGEAVIGFYTDSIENSQVTQGFQQPYFLLKELKSKSLCEIDLRIWPNPTERYVHLEVGAEIKLEDVTCFIYHLNGSQIAEYKIEQNSQIDLLKYQLNALILHFVDHQSNCHKIFKVIKN